MCTVLYMYLSQVESNDNMYVFQYVFYVYRLFIASLLRYVLNVFLFYYRKYVLTYVGLDCSMFYHTWDCILVCSVIHGIISSFLKRFRHQFQNSDLFSD